MLKNSNVKPHTHSHQSAQVDFDAQHIWHPYSTPQSFSRPNLLVKSAKKAVIEVEEYGKLIDGMSSWWCVIHGYNHPKLNKAIEVQLEKFAHVMFGGFTHQSAIDLASLLLDVNRQQGKPLFQSVFLADSGSVSVEVALKMSLQFQMLDGQPLKNKIMTLKGGYHGDTLGAMSVCDPEKGMHQLFNNYIPKQLFAPRPPKGKIDQELTQKYIDDLTDFVKTHHRQTAAFILEPIVQGAGGMHFYSKEVLKLIRALCDEYQIILIFDEIATGFGRTGKLFAYEHAEVVPDILCLGKAMSGGYLNIAAVLVKQFITSQFTDKDAKLMHGPTFMANPLACSVALASIQLLIQSNWQKKITKIEKIIHSHFIPLQNQYLKWVKDVRVLGAIGVIELTVPELSTQIQKKCLSKGIWIRPFGELVYIMPPYCIKKRQLKYLCSSLTEIIKNL